MAPKRKAAAQGDVKKKTQKAAIVEVEAEAEADESEGGLPALVAALKGKATVSVNADKPRKGAFVVSVGEAKIVDLVDMKRPFTALKALDMDQVAADTLAALAK
ncbi:hypothetical protein M885DRAFT_578772 [Pelagophyceae sp. CCMP2097]|nr:hypothetical protein M885DRAFT_578772 [Pelagophyceae sp. CCMP2097]